MGMSQFIWSHLCHKQQYLFSELDISVKQSQNYQAGWDTGVIVWDDREDIISTFTGEGETLTGDLSTAIQMEPIDEHTRVVIVTRNAEVDSKVLPLIVETPAAYIGLMGSSQRWKVVRNQLIDSGMSTKELERIATPIGIEIAAESPEEIAVSILAEVIAGDNLP